MNNIEKALNNKRRRQVEIKQETETLDMEIKALEAAIRIMRGKSKGKKSPAVKPVAKAAKSPAVATSSTKVASDIYRDYTAPKAIQHILKTKKLKASASQITKLLLEGGWRTKSNKPANSIYITLARMAANKTIKRSKKGKQTVFRSL